MIRINKGPYTIVCLPRFSGFAIRKTATGVTTDIEQYIIDRVRERRVALGISQIELAQKLNMSDSFVAHVETPKRRAKYNINHLNALARILDCSPRHFLPEHPL